MLPPVGVEPRASDFKTLHATVWANCLFAESLTSLDPYIYSHALLIVGLRQFFGIKRADQRSKGLQTSSKQRISLGSWHGSYTIGNNISVINLNVKLTNMLFLTARWILWQGFLSVSCGIPCCQICLQSVD